MKTILKYALFACLGILYACDTNKLNENSIFEDIPTLDSTSYTYEFDKWLYQNYTEPYNLKFDYKLQDNASDQGYNLSPVAINVAERFARVTLYLWFDVYSKMVNDDFLKEYGPRMIMLVGSAAVDASLGTIKLGTAEGGIKVTLYLVNDFDPTNIEHMNEYFFKTMHHEFAHILHQTKNYPKEYEAISAGLYTPNGWAQLTDEEVQSKGFVTPYGSSQAREDFVEVIANYIVKNDADWNKILDNASKEWDLTSGTPVLSTTVTDGIDGKAIIEQKLEICRSWLKEKWDIDLDALRAEVQYRQDNLDVDAIMSMGR